MSERFEKRTKSNVALAAAASSDTTINVSIPSIIRGYTLYCNQTTCMSIFYTYAVDTANFICGIMSTSATDVLKAADIGHYLPPGAYILRHYNGSGGAANMTTVITLEHVEDKFTTRLIGR